jgi:hypothetical protein
LPASRASLITATTFLAIVSGYWGKTPRGSVGKAPDGSVGGAADDLQNWRCARGGRPPQGDGR